MYLRFGCRANKTTESLTEIRLLIRYMVLTGQGDKTLMIASPNDPIERVPRLVWYEMDGIPQVDTVWEDRPRHPIKTFLEWAKENI